MKGLQFEFDSFWLCNIVVQMLDKRIVMYSHISQPVCQYLLVRTMLGVFINYLHKAIHMSKLFIKMPPIVLNHCVWGCRKPPISVHWAAVHICDRVYMLWLWTHSIDGQCYHFNFMGSIHKRYWYNFIKCWIYLHNKVKIS